MCINLFWLEIWSVFVESMENRWRDEDVRQKIADGRSFVGRRSGGVLQFPPPHQFVFAFSEGALIKAMYYGLGLDWLPAKALLMDTLHRHMPQTGVDGMQELSKIAIRFEEEIFSNSQNQQDYLWKISMKMISLETKANNNNNQFPAGANQRPIEHTSVESSSQAGQLVIAEWQENVNQRLQAVKDMYFLELKDLFQELNYRCQNTGQCLCISVKNSNIIKRNCKEYLIIPMLPKIIYLQISKKSMLRLLRSESRIF